MTPHSLYRKPPGPFDTYVDGCSFTSGIFNTLNKSWYKYLPGRVHSSSWPGKDNFSIFNDVFYTISNFDLKRIIVYWTYPERFSLPILQNGSVTTWPNKSIQPGFSVDKTFFDYVKYNLNFMYLIQEACIHKNINCIFLTTIPKYYYEHGDNGLYEKINRVINWPGPVLNTDYHIWCNSLQILFGSFFNVLDNDGMHLNEEGHKLFYDKMILPFFENKEIEQPWTTSTSVNWLLSAPNLLKEQALKNSRIETINNLKSNLNTKFIYEHV